MPDYEISAIQVGSNTYSLRDASKLAKVTTTTTKDQEYIKYANGTQGVRDVVVANSTGTDSVVNVTADVARSNTAGGAYSVAFGSRNIIGSSASESGAFGGDIHINSENTYGFGYHVWAHSNQNLLGGYDVGSNAKESLIYGNTIGIDCIHDSSTHTWTANSTAESDKSKYLMVFGDHHTVGSKALSDLIVGSTHTVGNNFQYSVLSGKSQTIGDNVEYVNVFGGSGNKLGENGSGLSDCTVFGYQNTLYGGTYSTSSGTNKIDNVYIMGSHNANSKNTTSSNFKHSVWMFGHYLAPVENGQFIIGEYNKTSSNDQPNAYFLVGTGDASTRRTSFAVCYNSTYGSHVYIGNVRIAESGSNISVNGSDVSLSGHTHSASSITSGTFGIARIPTGSSSTTSSSYVVKCDDSRLSDARPASDVSAWAKAASKPSYTLDEVSDGTTRKLSDYALATHNHDSSYVAKNTAITGATKCKITYDSKGLVTSGSDLEASDIPNLSAGKITSGTFALARIPTGTDANSVALGNHTHSLTLAADSGTPTVTLSHNTTYKLTAGGNSVIFKTPSDSNTNYYHTPVYSSGLKIGTGTGVSDMYVPNGSTTSAGVLQIGTGASNAAAGNHNHDSSYVAKNTAITGATKCKITYDSKGLVTSGGDLTASDIPSLAASKITSGTFADERIASASTWNAKYAKPSGGIPASDLAESYALSTHNHDSSYVAKNSAITAGTKCKITYDAKGLVTAGSDLTATDIPNLSADKITSGTFAIARIPTGDSTSTSADLVVKCNDSRLSDARPASDVASWAKSSTKPGYSFSEISSRYQALLSWGGPDLSGDASPIDVAIIDDLGHNKFAFMSAAGVVIQYSRDGGSTWVDYGATDNEKKSLVTLSGSFSIGKRTGSSNTINDKLRIILNSNAAGGNVYTSLRRLLLNVNRNGSSGCTVKIETRTIGNYKNNVDTWADNGTHPVQGWSGWNSPSFSCTFGGGSDQTSQTAQIRLTFGVTAVSTTYDNFQLLSIRAIGFPLWSSPSTMASNGHLYSFDISQNATFPASVSATTFSENGTTLANKYLGKSAKAADSAKLNGQEASYYQVALPTTTTAGKVLKSTSTAGTVEWADDSNTNTWRNIKVDGTEKLGTGTGTGALNFVSQNTNNGDITFTYDNGNGIKAKAKFPTLATVATSGSYNDLSNKPTIPTDTNQKIKADTVTFGNNDVVNIVAGDNVTVTGLASGTGAPKITISATDTWRPVGTGSTDAAAGNHVHGNINNDGTITSTAVTSATGVLVYDSNNKIQRATAASARSIIGAGTYSKPSGGIPDTDIASASTWNGKYSKPSGGIPATDLAESYYLSSNPNGYTSNTGTVIGSGLTADYLVLGNGTVNVKISSYKPSSSSTTWSTSSDVYLPTMKAISSYVTGLGYTTNTGTVIGSDLTADRFVLGNGTVNVKKSTYAPGPSSTTWSDSSDVYLPTMKSVVAYVTGKGYVTTDRYHTSGSWSGLTYTATANGGAGALSFTIQTGTTSTTVAAGDHNHDSSYVGKVTTGSSARLYGVDASNAQTMYTIGTSSGNIYQMPSTGIAKSHLASGVQASLGKADTAYQKPSTGIPASDLSESYLEESEDVIKAVYGTRPDEIHGTTAEQVMYTIGTSADNIVQRTTNGQIVLPNQLTYAPDDDNAISKRWVVAQGYTTNTGTVIGSSLTANKLILGNGGVNIKNSTYEPGPYSTTWDTSSDVYLPTMRAVSAHVSSRYVRYDTNAQGLSAPEKANARTNIGAQVALPTTSTAGKVLKSTSTSGLVEWGDGGSALYRHNLEWVVKTGSSPNYDYIHFYGYIITNSSTAYTASSYFGSITTLFKKTVLTGGFMDASDADRYEGIETHWLPNFNKNNNLNGAYINYRYVGDYDTYNVLFYTTTVPYAFTDHVEPNCDLS